MFLIDPLLNAELIIDKENVSKMASLTNFDAINHYYVDYLALKRFVKEHDAKEAKEREDARKVVAALEKAHFRAKLSKNFNGFPILTPSSSKKPRRAATTNLLQTFNIKSFNFSKVTC